MTTYQEPSPATYNNPSYTYNGAIPGGPERLPNYVRKRNRRTGIGYGRIGVGYRGGRLR